MLKEPCRGLSEACGARFNPVPTASAKRSGARINTSAPSPTDRAPDLSCPPPIMNFNDQSRSCHPERVSRSPERSEGEGSASEASRCPSSETPRFAQGDKTLPMLVVKNHHRGSHIARLHARAFAHPMRIVLTDGADGRVLAATRTLVQESAIRPILVGQAASILPQLEHMGVTEKVDVYDPSQDLRQLYDGQRAHLQWSPAGPGRSC